MPHTRDGVCQSTAPESWLHVSSFNAITDLNKQWLAWLPMKCVNPPRISDGCIFHHFSTIIDCKVTMACLVCTSYVAKAHAIKCGLVSVHTQSHRQVAPYFLIARLLCDFCFLVGVEFQETNRKPAAAWATGVYEAMVVCGSLPRSPETSARIFNAKHHGRTNFQRKTSRS